MIEYKGVVNGYSEYIVYKVEDGVSSPLPLRLAIRYHSPNGFCWGYSGSGPSQLALAMLADCCDSDTALKYYFEFRDKFIALLPTDEGFILSQDAVKAFLINKLLNETDTK